MSSLYLKLSCVMMMMCVCCVNTNERHQQRYSCFLKKKPQKNKTYIVEAFFCWWSLSLPFRRQDVPILDKSQNYAERRRCPHELINLLAPDEDIWFELKCFFCILRETLWIKTCLRGCVPSKWTSLHLQPTSSQFFWGPLPLLFLVFKWVSFIPEPLRNTWLHLLDFVCVIF